MGFFDMFKGEFIDVVEWVDESNDTLVWRFDRYQNEIKNGAQLVVRQSQIAVFVNEGKIADVFTSGMHELKTENLPILSTLRGWKYGFNSPFKAEVYFINLRTFTDIKWGTKNPIQMRDTELGVVRIRAFGNFSIKVQDPELLLEEIVGTDGHFTLDEIDSQLKSLTISRFSDALGESKIPVFDLAANYNELSSLMKRLMNEDFLKYGITLQNFLVENISLPAEVEAAIDKRSSMGLFGDLNKYTQFQAANAMEAAASNTAGSAGAVMGMGMGVAMANQVAASQTQQQQPAPPAIPGAVTFFVAVNGQQTGPFTVMELQTKVTSEHLTNDTLVWADGMPAWMKAHEVPQLTPLFKSAPPPIPKG
ncbi:SPFH domain-containing protein [Marinomonas sp. TI.3.20]|uniref:SPFH domain-containing protein n=1 Tax=Marinomonas sp. TI.3.20 TaxID=3121296 RepID=UPI00311FA567